MKNIMNSNTLGKTILVVDDTPANTAILVEHLEHNGFQVVVAQDGEDCIMRAQFVGPDLIFMDVMMPGMNGFETCRRLKASVRTKDIPVIFMTAPGDTNEKAAGFNAGGADYITKPFQIQEVMARVNTHLTLRQTTQDLAQALKTLSYVQEELKRKEKLTALCTLVAGIAHELNTPIDNSLTVTNALFDKTRKLEEIHGSSKDIKQSLLRAYVNNVDQASEILMRNLHRAANLVTSFKEVAINRSQIERNTFSLADVISESTWKLESALKKASCVVDKQIPGNILLDSYPDSLAQVIAQLLINALTHGLEGRDNPIITITGRVGDGNTVEIAIKDNGAGISSTNLPRIFEPFFTTKLASGSTGLGLNICHNIVTDVLGGRIDVESEASIGSTFTLTLPRIAP